MLRPVAKISPPLTPDIIFDIRPHGLALDTVELFAVPRGRLSEFELFLHKEHLTGAVRIRGQDICRVLLVA